MQAAASAKTAVFPGFSDQFKRHIDAVIKTRCKPELLWAQIALHISGTHCTMPDGETIDVSQVSTLKLERSLTLLPTIRKIKVVIESLGFAEAQRALRHDSSGNRIDSPIPAISEAELKNIEVFQKEIALLTQRIVSIDELDDFQVLRVFLFAAIEKCLNKAKILSKSVKKNSEGSVVMTSIEIIERSRFGLLQMFAYLYFPEGSNTFIAANDLINQVFDELNEMKKSLYAKSNINERNILEKDLQDILNYLGIFKTALQQPLVYLPLMMSRICNEDRGAVPPSISTWLDRFVLSWRGQSSTLIPLLKKMNRQSSSFLQLARKVDKMMEAILQSAEQVNLEITRALNELHDVERLGKRAETSAKIERLLATAESLDKLFLDFIQNQLKMIAAVKDLMSNNLGSVPKRELWSLFKSKKQLEHRLHEEIIQPNCHYFRLASTIIERIKDRGLAYRKFYLALDQVMDACPFKTLHSIPLMDLLQWQMHRQFFTLFEMISSDEKLVDALLSIIIGLDLSFLGPIRNRLISIQSNPDVTFEERSQWANGLRSAATLININEQLSASTYPEVKPILNQYKEFCEALNTILLSSNWLRIVTFNPYAEEREQPEEERFYFELYLSCRQILLMPERKEQNDFDKYLLQAAEDKDKPFVDDAKRCRKYLLSISEVGKAIQKEPPVTVETYKPQAKSFIERISKYYLGLDQVTRKLELSLSLYLAETNPSSEALQELSRMLPDLPGRFQLLLLSPAQRLIIHYALEELVEADKIAANKRQERATEKAERKKKLAFTKPQVKEINALVVKSTPAPAEQPAVQTLTPLVKTFQQLEQRFLAWLEPKKASDSQQGECARILLGNLRLLNDLVGSVERHGERPHFIIECNLALMVIMEQILSFFSQRGPLLDARSVSIYRKMGLESEWRHHAPHLLMPESEGPYFTFMQKRERVIAISSRYPGSEADSLTDSVNRALNATKQPQLAALVQGHYRKATQDVLDQGMQACLAMLEALKVPNTIRVLNPEVPADFETLLAPMPGLEINWEAAVKTCFSQFENTLARIHKIRATAYRREVQESELNGQQRKGTISLALDDLDMTAQLSCDLLLSPNDASQSLIISKQAWLRQAVALERVLLLVLCHLPARHPGSDHHCLWEEKDRRPLRYSHQLTTYVQLVRQFLPQVPSSLLDETEALAQDLEPYLKTLYRYLSDTPGAAKERLDKIYGLMALRAQLHQNLEGWTEGLKSRFDQKLGASSSKERMPLLDAHILGVVRSEATLPLLETFDLAEEWLGIYEKLLLGRAY